MDRFSRQFFGSSSCLTLLPSWSKLMAPFQNTSLGARDMAVLFSLLLIHCRVRVGRMPHGLAWWWVLCSFLLILSLGALSQDHGLAYHFWAVNPHTAPKSPSPALSLSSRITHLMPYLIPPVDFWKAAHTWHVQNRTLDFSFPTLFPSAPDNHLLDFLDHPPTTEESPFNSSSASSTSQSKTHPESDLSPSPGPGPLGLSPGFLAAS